MATITYLEPYKADEKRYEKGMAYTRCGKSGLQLPRLSLGFWWNFGGIDTYYTSMQKVLRAFDSGVFCFDLANNYGPPFGSAEDTFGKIYHDNLRPYRHEMIVTTKAGYNMWAGPNGIGSTRKMLMASIDESLQRLKMDYVDIFYSHRYDSETPIEETMQALVDIVHAGKALYVGLSNYPAEHLPKALYYLSTHDVPCLIYQGRYNMIERGAEDAHFTILDRYGTGFSAFVPLAQGILSNKYLNGIPADSRAALGHHLSPDKITPDLVARLTQLNTLAAQRGQSLAQMATSWLLAKKEVTSVIIGPRTMEQLEDSLGAVKNCTFTADELATIDQILAV